MTKTYIQQLQDKTITPQVLATRIRRNPTQLSDLLTGLHSNKATIRYGCSKTLIILSTTDPTLLYPHFNVFVTLLESPYRILTWNALTILANLTLADTQKKFEKIMNTYYHHLTDGDLITVNTIVQASPTIANAKPHLTDTIIHHLLSTNSLPTGPHLTTECKHIIATKTIQALDILYPHTTNHTPILTYVTQHANSTRGITRKTAQTFLKKHGDSP